MVTVNDDVSDSNSTSFSDSNIDITSIPLTPVSSYNPLKRARSPSPSPASPSHISNVKHILSTMFGRDPSSSNNDNTISSNALQSGRHFAGELPPCTKNTDILTWVCKGKPRRGKFDTKKALARGLKPGRSYGKKKSLFLTFYSFSFEIFLKNIFIFVYSLNLFPNPFIFFFFKFIKLNWLKEYLYKHPMDQPFILKMYLVNHPNHLLLSLWIFHPYLILILL